MDNSTKKILLVDVDLDLLESLAEYLAVDQDHYRTFTTADGREALEVLAREDICLVVSDINMLEISGLDLLTNIRATYPEIDVIIMTEYGTEDIRDELKMDGCLYFLEKPFKAEHLRQLIYDRVINKDDGFAGTLKNIQLNDLIQTFVLSGTGMAISVTKGSQQGTIFIEDGEIIHAVCENSTGEDAFYRILAWESGSFETLGSVSVPQRSIHKNSQYLIMEAARLVDEQAMEDGEPEAMEDGEPDDMNGEIRLVDEHDGLRVLIVDDSPMMCRILEDILTVDEDISVVGIAENGEDALKKIAELKPDLITLDVNMPVMDGSTALKHIMINNPCPVVIVSNLGSRSHINVLDFLRLGAVDFIGKPTKGEDMTKQRQKIVEKIRMVAKANINNFKRVKPPKVFADKNWESGDHRPCRDLVVINSGTGGYAEIIKVIPFLSRDMNACVVALQTMPSEFVVPLSDYLNKRSRADVLPLKANVPLLAGRCYMGTNDLFLKLDSKEGEYALRLEEMVLTSEQDPGCFDAFLQSIARSFSGSVLAVLLSGAEVGDLSGLRSIKERNGRIIIQQLRSCMVPFPLEKARRAQLPDSEDDPVEIARQIVACPD